MSNGMTGIPLHDHTLDAKLSAAGWNPALPA
jgi:hypothetical protein